MRDTPILDFVFPCILAVVYGILGSLIDYWIYWVACGAALVCCVATLLPAVRAVRRWHKGKRSKGKRSNSSYKIIIRSVDGSKICDGCGKKTEHIGKCIAISGNERHEAYLCEKCFLKGVTDALKSEDQTEEGGESHEDS